MKFTLDSPGTVSVRSVSPDGVRIADSLWTSAVLLTSDGEVTAWDGPHTEALAIDDLAPVLGDATALLILGTGHAQLMPNRELTFAMARLGKGLEVMDTPAAARTYNVLVAEGRSVAAILYPV